MTMMTVTKKMLIMHVTLLSLFIVLCLIEEEELASCNQQIR